jgi:hypothetical protein
MEEELLVGLPPLLIILYQPYQGKNWLFRFFDCIDDLAIAQSLLSTAENWLKNQQVNRIIGPLSPSTAGKLE